MRFFLGLIIGIALTIGVAAYHDNNIATPPRGAGDRPIVDWGAAQAAVGDSTAFVKGWWDDLMGRVQNPPQR
jgi:hypothetical protein